MKNPVHYNSFIFQKSVQKSGTGCDCICTCGGEGGEDPPTRPGNRRHRRVMFTDECNCDAWDDDDEEKDWDVKGDGQGRGCSECDEHDLHYQSPKEVDGDYSYAYRYRFLKGVFNSRNKMYSVSSNQRENSAIMFNNFTWPWLAITQPLRTFNLQPIAWRRGRQVKYSHLIPMFIGSP